jgi:ATP-binding cassette subfamily F protein uup
MRKELDWIRRQPKARGTKAKYRIDAFHDLKEVAHKRVEKNEVKIALSGQRLGKKVLEIEGLGKSFDELTIIDNFSYIFKKADRIGIIGHNGSGKSTFLKLITGDLQPDSGNIVVGDTVSFGYYKQEGLDYTPGNKVIDEVTIVAEFLTLSDGSTVSASQLLNQFNFSPKKQHDFVEKLSGGEKRRLQLLKVLIKNPNFLILDEPTNDLDLQTLNTLEDYLESYGGCLVVVSHDRYFLDRLADHLFVLDGTGFIKDFPGNFTDYRSSLKTATPNENSSSAKPVGNKSKTDKKKLSFNEQREFDSIEGEIAKLEVVKAEINQQLLDIVDDYEKLAKLGKQLEEVEAQIETKEMRWLELSEKLG